MQQKNWFKNLAKVMIAALAVCGLVFGLAACSQSDEDQIKSVISAEFDELTKADASTIEEALGDTASELESYGIDPVELWKAMFGKFTYDIVDVHTDGDTGYATLDVSNIDLEEGLNSWMSEMSAFATSSEALEIYSSEGEDGLMKEIMGMLITSLTSDDLKMVSNTVEVNVEKNDGSWELADPEGAFSAVFGGADPNSILGSLL